jgi:type IV pilus assembly protein PilC
VRGALIYPAIIIMVALVIALAVTFFVLPRITGLFQILEIELPLATQVLITFASFLRNNFILILFGILLLVVIINLLQRFRFFKFYFDKIRLYLPFVGSIFQNLGLARFSRTFFTLLKSGMPVLGALEICSETHPNEVFSRNILTVRLGVERGEKISQGLKKSPRIFPAIFSQMVLIGEKSGTLEESFLYLANFYEREVDSTLKNLSGILEPILLILVGIFVAFIALAIIIPIYRFIGALRLR